MSELRLASGEIPSLRIGLGALEDVRVRTGWRVQYSLLTATADAYTGHGRTSALLRAEIRAALCRKHGLRVSALGPLAGKPPAFLLPCVTASGYCFTDVADYLDYLREVTADTVASDLERAFSARVPAVWRPVLERPGSWVADLVSVLSVASSVMGPFFDHARRVARREGERLGVAVVSGALEGLLADLGPRMLFADQALHFGPGWPPESTELSTRTLRMLPHALGAKHLCIDDDQPGEIVVEYPAPLRTGYDADRATVSNTLEIVLGPRRSRLLQLLDRPRAMADVAALLGCSAATATYHCDQLVAAGLLTRARHQQSVAVSRSDHGERLLDLLS